MTPTALLLILLSQAAMVAGQIFLKHAMEPKGPTPVARRVGSFVAGLVLLSGWFFLWTGLLQQLPLSFVYPFEGISVVLLVLFACLFLRERLSARSWIGVACVTAGVALVGVSHYMDPPPPAATTVPAAPASGK
jgi:drug/metabolite transporter (DMT)-like permease